MDAVYETTNRTDAQLVADVLGRAGIDAQVVGEHIAPYAGPLGSVRVLVSSAQSDEARACLGEWERSRLDGNSPPPRPERRTRDTLIVLAFAATLLLTLWYLMGT